MTGGGLLAGGCSAELLQWLLARRELFTDRRRRVVWQLKYGSYWFERHLRYQQPIASKPKAQGPLSLVLGFWRSGTTLLHNRLYGDYDCTTPLTWQCFNPANHLIRLKPVHDRVAQRPMDGGVVHSLGPQEDEFAALLLGDWSLYRGFLDPASLPALAEELGDAPAFPCLAWTRFIAELNDGGPAPMLLKSPNHVFRLGMIREKHPGSRAVWIVRPFEDVFRSNVTMWETMCRTHSLTQPRPDLIENFVTKIATIYADVVERESERRDPAIAWLPFDALIEHTAEATAASSRFLGLSPRAQQALPVGRDSIVHPSTVGRPTILGNDARRVIERVDAIHSTLLRSTGQTLMV